MDVRILIKDKKKWNYLNFKNFEVFYRDISLDEEGFNNLISKIKNIKNLDHRQVNKIVRKLHGHFAIIIKAKNGTKNRIM